MIASYFNSLNGLLKISSKHSDSPGAVDSLKNESVERILAIGGLVVSAISSNKRLEASSAMSKGMKQIKLASEHGDVIQEKRRQQVIETLLQQPGVDPERIGEDAEYQQTVLEEMIKTDDLSVIDTTLKACSELGLNRGAVMTFLFLH